MHYLRCAGLLLLVPLALPAEPDEPLPRGAVARLGSTRFQQGGLVQAVAFSPDGKLLASSGEDAFVRFWDPATGGQLSESTRHHHGVHHITYAKDGKTIASVSHGAIRLLDGTTGKERRILRLPKSSDAYLGPVFAAAFTPDGAALATTLDNKEIQLWDTATGATGHRLKGHTERVGALTYCLDGKLLASASDDATVKLWNPASGELLHTLQGHKGRILALLATPDGKTLATTGADGTVRLWDPATVREVGRIEVGPRSIYCLACSADGKSLATGDQASGVRLWDIASRKELAALRGNGAIGGLAFAPDGKTLVAADSTLQLRLWDIATRQPKFGDPGHRGRVTALAFAPDGKSLVSGGLVDNPRRWDVATGKVLQEYADLTKVRHLAFDGKTLTAVTSTQQVRRWDAAGMETQRFGRDAGIQDAFAAVTPDGRLVAWNDNLRIPERNEWRRIVGIWDAAAGKEVVQTPSPEYQLYALALAPDGHTLLSSGSNDRSVGLYEIASGKRRISWPGTEAGVSAAAFSPDGRVVATGGWDNMVWIHDRATGKVVRRLPQAGTVHALDISAGGKLVASAGGGHRAILVRDLATGKDLHRFTGHRGDVYALAFSPDGGLLASAGDDGLVFLWDVRGAQQQASAPRLAALQPGDLPTLWADLTGENPEKAHRAMWSLTAMPKEAPAFLTERLRTTLPDAALVRKLLAGLDDDDFDVREKSQEELAEMGELVAPALRKTLENPPSAEVRQRVQQLVAQLDGKIPLVEVRGLRAVEVLERIGTPEARTVLEAIAKGTPSRTTQAAQTALVRMPRS